MAPVSPPSPASLSQLIGTSPRAARDIVRRIPRSSTTSPSSPPSATAVTSSVWRRVGRRFATAFGGRKEPKERVVILGSGWAGYAFARTLDPAKFERVVISPRSYFVFTPLLASTAVGTLEFRATLEPVRRLGDVRFRQGWADDIDFSRKAVQLELNVADDMSTKTVLPPPRPKTPTGDGSETIIQAVPPHPQKGPMVELAYDKLVIAVGAYSQTFGIEGVRQHAHFLRDIGDARRVRLRVLSIFEQCANSLNSRGTGPDPDLCRRLLHFAVVGGGPTGIEFAAELHDLVHENLARLYPELMPFVAITVYDIAPKVLPMFDQALADYATRLFGRQGIEVKTEHHLQRIRLAGEDERDGLWLKIQEHGDQEVSAGIVVWSTGLMQNPLVEKLMQKTAVPDSAAVASASDSDASQQQQQQEQEQEQMKMQVQMQQQRAGGGEYHLQKHAKTGGIITDPFLQARLRDPSTGTRQVLKDVFVLGDCAVIEDQKSLPKTAQVASQEAVYLAKGLNKGDLYEKPFKFKNWGTMTYLGNWKAIHQSGADRLTGWAAWVLWRTAYLTKSMSIRNKIMVPVYWAISWIFGRDISRF